MTIIVPAPGELSATAKLLLELADDVQDVRTISNGTLFEVPDELAERYHEVSSTPSSVPVQRRGRRVQKPVIKEEE